MCLLSTKKVKRGPRGQRYLLVKYSASRINNNNKIYTPLKLFFWNAEMREINYQDVQLLDLNGETLADEQDVPFFPLAVIRAATQEFAQENKLGQGGFGPVYKVHTTVLLTFQPHFDQMHVLLFEHQ